MVYKWAWKEKLISPLTAKLHQQEVPSKFLKAGPWIWPDAVDLMTYSGNSLFQRCAGEGACSLCAHKPRPPPSLPCPSALEVRNPPVTDFSFPSYPLEAGDKNGKNLTSCSPRACKATASRGDSHVGQNRVSGLSWFCLGWGLRGGLPSLASTVWHLACLWGDGMFLTGLWGAAGEIPQQNTTRE